MIRKGEEDEKRELKRYLLRTLLAFLDIRITLLFTHDNTYKLIVNIDVHLFNLLSVIFFGLVALQLHR